MRTLIVSRHPGAIAWLRHLYPGADVICHLDDSRVSRGDTVIGTLPVHLLAELQERGVRCVTLVVPLDATSRGRELDLVELTSLAPKLVEYRVERLS